ncbi:snare complex subunit [Diplodia corticola]|uniref:Snare complex subunit n=1 Tax=Diplodia corticola TaxID=236234 RepID=A0A1J9QSZ9_9PEZI|nr:snare complex subunit [Diplodia corticola]OJD31529.1 snare complex subunit [Diplodia corticola]
MSSRFSSNLHQRDARSQLFSPYDQRKASPSPHSRPASRSPAGAGYGFPAASSAGPAFSAYPGGSNSNPPSQSSYRSATPNTRGQYSDAVLSELESQNDEELSGMSAKVRMLKDITTAIGDEIRDSTALAEKMNDSFDNTRVRLRGTMNRMLRMAERTGVGWKVWVAFFAAVILLFWYVWLF